MQYTKLWKSLDSTVPVSHAVSKHSATCNKKGMAGYFSNSSWHFHKVTGLARTRSTNTKTTQIAHIFGYQSCDHLKYSLYGMFLASFPCQVVDSSMSNINLLLCCTYIWLMLYGMHCLYVWTEIPPNDFRKKETVCMAAVTLFLIRRLNLQNNKFKSCCFFHNTLAFLKHSSKLHLFWYMCEKSTILSGPL